MTNKASSENLSICHSVAEVNADGSYREVMRRVPSNSSYLNKISHSGLNMKQALHTSSEAAAQAARQKANASQGANGMNIY